jgi:hypothetical protein
MESRRQGAAGLGAGLRQVAFMHPTGSFAATPCSVAWRQRGRLPLLSGHPSDSNATSLPSGLPVVILCWINAMLLEAE